MYCYVHNKDSVLQSHCHFPHVLSTICQLLAINIRFNLPKSLLVVVLVLPLMPKELYCSEVKSKMKQPYLVQKLFSPCLSIDLPSRSNIHQPVVKPSRFPSFSLPWAFPVNCFPRHLLRWLTYALFAGFCALLFSANLIFFCLIRQGVFNL